MPPRPLLRASAVFLCVALAPSAVAQPPELIDAFIFGSRVLSCSAHSEPGTNYTVVHQGTAGALEYEVNRGWGYEATHAGSGYDRFGPFDDSANNRNAFGDACPEEIYDSFIGAKNWSTYCGPSDPCGIVFRVDVPNGDYRFVAAVGSADNVHTHRIVVEDGGSGPPIDMGPDHVVLVDNFDQAVHGAGVFARVGFDGRIPPPAVVNGFVDMDESGLETTPGAPSSPVLTVTQGYIRLHQLRASTVGGDPNGGDMVILELWRVAPEGPDVTPPEVSSISPVTGATLRSLSEIQVAFTETVLGVDAGDLLIDGAPATSVSGSGAGPYVFGFAARADGAVAVGWSPSHGIVDTSEFSNPFAGGSWSYTVDSTAPVGDLVINELMASNVSGITDEEGDTPDWIEIHNRASEVINLANWSVTDDPDEPGKFVLPAVDLGPLEYLVVFASGKNRAPSNGAPIHTNFELTAEGEYVGLFNEESPRRLVMEIAPRYPRQTSDVSYGLDGPDTLAYFQTPTPGAANAVGSTFDGFAIEPIGTPGRGFFDAPVDVELFTVTPGASIRYTLDGSEPTPARGTVYSGPVRIDGMPGRGIVMLRAIAYRSGFIPSRVTTNSYVFVEDVMRQPSNPAGFPAAWNSQTADYEMDPTVVDDPGHNDLVRQGLRSIPTLSISTDVENLFDNATGIYANPSREGIAWERPVSAELIYPDDRDGTQIDCGLRIQGGSSTGNWKSIKVSMRLLFKSDYGASRLRFPLFPDSRVGEFNTLVLDAHLNQTWNHPSHGQRVRAQYCRDQFCSDLQNAMGGHAPHDVFVNLYLDGLYWGVYDVHERPDAAWASSYFGGDEREWDSLRHSGSNVVDGNSAAWSTMRGLAGQNLALNSNYEALAAYLDVPGLIDYMLVNIYAGNDDWPHHNWYATRRRVTGSLYRFHSWDAEHVIKSTTINRTGVNNSNTPAEFYSRLRANAEFRLLFADHVHRHFFNGGVLWVDPTNRAWDPDHPERNRPAAGWMRRIDEVDPAIACESARWGDAKRPGDPYTRNDEFLAELSWVLDYFENRSDTVLNQLRAADLYPSVGAPIFSRHGGRIAPGFSLTMSRPAGTSGTIWYTTDGTDPRVQGTSAVSNLSLAYSGAITLNDHTVLRARVRDGTTWSALNEATFSLADPLGAVKISEIMYNPIQGSAFEFIELHNPSALAVDLTGCFFSSGVFFAFRRGASIPAGGHVVVVSSAVAFQGKYSGAPFEGVYSGQLANEGEKLTLKTADGVTIDSVDFDEDGFWPIGPDGFGWSLVRKDFDAASDDPRTWRASAAEGGSPGEADPAPAVMEVEVNEVLARAAAPFEEAIELWNPNPAPVDVGGWFLSDGRGSIAELKKHRIAGGTIVPAGGLLVLYEADFGGELSLDNAGGSVFLSAANGAGDLLGFIREAEHAPSWEGVSSGRVSTSAGPIFAPLDGTSFGADTPVDVVEFRSGAGSPNASALFGPPVINEIMYHPSGDREEFIELFNPTGAAIELFEPALGVGWRIDGILDAFEIDDYEFAPGDVVPAGGYLLVVNIDSDVFRALHAVPGSVPIVGPFGGGLDNGGERVELLAPDDLDGVPLFVTVDDVRYNDRPPWPAEADGGGPSLERVSAAILGREPGNWAASTRLGGTPGMLNTSGGPTNNTPPSASFTATPSSGIAPLDVVLDASLSFDVDGVIVSWSWDFDDGALGSGEVVGHRFNTPGAYVISLTVEDDDGDTDSAIRVVAVEADPGGGQIIGDANQDAVLDISDAVSLLFRLFLADPGPLPCDGASIADGANRELLDFNDDGGVNVSDVIFELAFLFKNGPPPPAGVDCRRIVGCQEICAP